ncbi:S-adenosyl-L-methionine-dependent methyltransferase [Pilobolus umbonatus]|nr:S-adenosyl-L-methionine-dependent methyltransferase [Pilobolus umbonatus]
MVFSSFSECFGRTKHTSHTPPHTRNKPEPIVTDIQCESEGPVSPLSGSSEGRNFHTISGRRYNNDEDIAYILPNDDTEADRLHFQHWAMKFILNGLYKSPIHEMLENGCNVIDAGCGPATWTFDMAKTYSSSKFVGLDISFVFPETIRPPNVDFNICNITKDIPFEDNDTDFYFQRLLMGGLNENDYKSALRNAYRVLKPGGFIELSEGSMTDAENGGPIYTQINTIVSSMLEKRGLMPDMGQHIARFLKEVGFENVYFEKLMVPLNHTNKAGQLNWYDNREANKSLRPLMAMTNPDFEDAEKYEKFLDSLGEECAQYKTSTCFCIAYAQKPLE